MADDRSQSAGFATLIERRYRLKLAVVKNPFLIVSLLIGGITSVSAADWQSTLTTDPPGKFPAPRACHVKYIFGWSGITAGAGNVQFSRDAERYSLDGKGGSTGFARALWRYDVDYHDVVDANTLRPVETHQVETMRKKTVTTHLTFTSNGVGRLRSENPGQSDNKPRQTRLPNLHGLLSAMLYLRSQPLLEHNTYRVAVYPTTNAYVATINVLGHEKISVHAGTYNAIKCNMQLSKVAKGNTLEPHKKFTRATIWISDDNDRILLRAEAQIFVGTVYADLQSVQFDAAKH